MRNIVACLVALAVPVAANAAPGRQIALPAQALGPALQEVARSFDIELLFSAEIVGQRQAPAVTGHLTATQALERLLAGSGLAAREYADGSFTITAPAPVEVAVPDILVIGHLTQNTDIRRLASDVQPYQVLTRKDVTTSHAASVEELIGKRISANAGGLSFAQSPLSGLGSPQSSINLRGLGSDETLVLIDGRRLPRLPGGGLQFIQPDVNALAPEAIDRAEVLTSTAGGIHGPGAIAGVLNLVLRRDYQGAEVTVTSGITQRGDAPYARLDARLGFTSDDGRTKVMLAYSRSDSSSLRVGDRDYRERAAALSFAGIGGFYQYGDLPGSNSTNVASSTGAPLVLKPAYGGAALGSWLTNLPAGDGRSPAAIGSLLLANAGRLDFVPEDGAGGKRETLVVGRRTSSILANVRHQLGGDGPEIYADFLRLIDRGRITYQDAQPGISLAADDTRNPFQQAVDVSFPIAAYRSSGGQRTAVTRASVGALVDLPAEWKANLDLSVGSARQTLAVRGTNYNVDAFIALLNFAPANGARVEPFGDSTTLQSLFASNTAPTSSSSDLVNRFSDFSARLAGPVVTLGGGPLVATLLLEQRRERVGAGLSEVALLGQTVSMPSRAYGERVRSFYVELRAPLVSEDAWFAPLRGLEVQAAVRRDATRVTLGPDPAEDPQIVYDRLTSAGRAATVYTAGLKLKPVKGLLLRASFATGEMSPPLSELGARSIISATIGDPRRGGRSLGSEQPYELVVYGNKIAPEHSASLSAGFIVTPFDRNGPSLSVDYTRIRRTREVDGRLSGSVLSFILDEALFPGRVTRLPLTAGDAAQGFTGGIVTKIDTSYLSIGRTAIDAVDARLAVPVNTDRDGDFALHLAATWQPRYRRFVFPDEPVENLVNQVQGMLKWHGNAGVAWTREAWLLALNAQYYGSYDVADGTVATTDARRIALQGAARIPAQLTFDLAIGYRFDIARAEGKARQIDLRFGIQDLLDRHPATVVAAEASYSYYADPRRRRFELAVTTSF